MVSPRTEVTNELLTAADYARLVDRAQHTELVRGRVVKMNMPFPRHGRICMRIAFLIESFLEDHPLGQTVTNDSGVLTERNPDTVRGADVAYYSFTRLPKDGLGWAYAQVAPDLVFEVRSPSDRTPKVLAKVDEYLDAGVTVVCVVDESDRSATLYRLDQDEVHLTREMDFVAADVLPGFSVPLRKFFE